MRSFTLFLAAISISCSRPSSTNDTAKPTALAIDAAPTPPASVALNVVPKPTASIDNIINPTHAPPYSGPVGVVEGTIYVSGPPAPPMMGKSFSKCPSAAAVYGKTFREGAPLPDGKRPLGDAIVGITGYEGFIAETKPGKRINIVDCSYDMRTVTLTLGQRLEVLNKSRGLMYTPTLENQVAPAMMMATPGATDPVKLYPMQIGRYRLVDKSGNDWMEADVYVVGQPLHSESDVAGHFRIEGVPVGKLKVSARHPFIDGDVAQDVVVQSGVVTKIDITIPHDKDAPRPASIQTGIALP